MSTAVEGTLAARSLVVSMPSIPGIRTSMITTSGLRRSASATALSPSAASPRTRICGARESETRRPSRTISWSSTIRQEISSGTTPIVRSDRQRQLDGLGWRLEPDPAPVADSVVAAKLRDGRANVFRLLGREVGAIRVEALVALQLLGPVAGEVRQKVLAGAGLQIEEVRPYARRAGLSGGTYHLGQLLGPVGEAGEDRRHTDAGLDPRVDQALERPKALAGRRCARLGPAPDLGIERRDREADRDVCAACGLLEDVEVADDHRPAGDQGKGIARLGERLQAGTGEPVAPLGRLVRVGRRAYRDPLVLPGPPRQFAAQHLGNVDLH